MCNCNKKAGVTKNTAVAQNFSSVYFSQGKPKKKQATSGGRITANQLLPEVLENNSGETFAEKCQTFAYVLGLEDPVPEKVLVAAIENPDYAKRLLLYRNEPYFYELLNNPPEKFSKFSTTGLISKAGKALVQWGLSGFPTVSKETLQKREDACLACPNLVSSTSVLQKISASSKVTDEIGQRTGNKSCSKCGCVVTNKIRLETESCPEELSPGLNRWGESINDNS